MNAFPAAGDYYKAVQAPGPLLHRAQAPGRRVRLGQPRADAGPGQQRRGVPGLGPGQAPGAALLHQGRRLQPGPVQRAGRLPGRSRPEPVRVRHHLARRGDHRQPGALAGADHGLDRRPDAQRVRGLPGGRVQRRRPDHAGGPVARAGRAAPAERVRPRRPAARQRHGGPGRAAPPGRLRRGLDSAAGRAAPAHRVRPPELPAPRCTTTGTAGSTPSPPWSSTCRWSRWARIPGSGWPCTTPRTCCSPRPTSSPRSRPRPGSSWPRCGDPQVDELARKLQECCNPLWVSNRSLEATLEQPAAAPALPPVPADQRWWQQRPAPGAGPSGARPGVAVPARPGGRRRRPPRPRGQRLVAPHPPPRRPRVRRGLAARPAPAVRAARHGGHRTDAAAEPDDDAAQRHDLVDPAAGAARPVQARPRVSPAPGYRRLPDITGPRRPRPCPAGTRPMPPVPTPPGPPVPGPAAPATRTQTGPAVGAVALALGVLLLVIGAASHVSVVVIGGLVPARGACGGSSPRPGGAASRPANP